MLWMEYKSVLTIQLRIFLNDELKQLRVRRNLCEMRERGVKAVFFHIVLHLDRFRVVRVVEVKRGGNHRRECFGFLPQSHQLHGGRDKSIRYAELALRAAGDARHGIGEMRIFEPFLCRSDICGVFFTVKAVFLDK